MITTQLGAVEQQIRLQEKMLLDAVKKSDVQVLDELLHDNLLFCIPGGDTVTKAMDLAAHQSRQMVVNSLSASELVVQVIDEGTAVVSVKITTDGKMIDQPIAGDFRYIRVWKLMGTKWKIIGGSCSPIL
ncbi:MAG TPA: nuclear transport factor 2 family protein [Ohtaekwangia sp.]|nr:nuclear transport factor 2 family protein [Ohtaekwangia sp.]